MAIEKVWVLAETAEGGGPTPVTLELLTEARTVAATVEAVAWGAAAAALAGPLGEYGATTLYDVGDLGRRPGGRAGRRRAGRARRGRQRPRRHPLPGHLRGP